MRRADHGTDSLLLVNTGSSISLSTATDALIASTPLLVIVLNSLLVASDAVLFNIDKLLSFPLLHVLIQLIEV